MMQVTQETSSGDWNYCRKTLFIVPLGGELCQMFIILVSVTLLWSCIMYKSQLITCINCI